MPKKKEAIDVPAESAKDTPPEGALVKAAKTIGEAAGKIATAVGVAQPAKPKVVKLAKTKVAKLAKKSKPRMPRRQKKAAKKSARQL
jgi:hypothetical protein